MRHYITFILYQPCPKPLEPAQHLLSQQAPIPELDTTHGTHPRSPRGAQELSISWMLSVPDGQHPARIPGGARAAGRSQHCRFSSHGAGQEGFAAPQDRARSEAAPAPGGRQSSGHGQPEGHSWDHIFTLLWPPGRGMHPSSRDSHTRRDCQLCWRQREEADPGEAAGSEPQGSATAGSGDRLRLPVQAGVPSSLAQVGRNLSLVYLLLPPSQALQPLITSCRSLFLAPCATLHSSITGQVRPLTAPRLEPTGSAGSLPASCPVPAAPCLRLRPPLRGAPEQGPPGRRLCPRGYSAPARASGSPSRQVLEVSLDPEEMPARWHMALLPVVPAGPLLAQAGLGCCVPPASPAPPAAAGWPPQRKCCREPWQDPSGASPSQGRRAPWQGPAAAEVSSQSTLPTDGRSSRAGTCRPGAVSPHCERGQLQPCFILHHLPSSSRGLVAPHKRGQEPV